MDKSFIISILCEDLFFIIIIFVLQQIVYCDDVQNWVPWAEKSNTWWMRLEDVLLNNI